MTPMSETEERIWRIYLADPAKEFTEIAREAQCPLADVWDTLAKIGTSELRPRQLSEPPTRQRILAAASDATCGPREENYGKPGRNLANIADLWASYIEGKHGADVPFNAEDVAHMMVLVKIARTFSGVYNEDTYVDIAGYGALAGEVGEGRG